MTNFSSQPDIKSSFISDGVTYYIDWYDLDDEVPDLPWSQVYALGDVNGLVPIVHYANRGDNLPGGRTEPGETAEETLIREIQEEINHEVISWSPIGYQVWCNPVNGDNTYQLRLYAKMRPIGEFISDPGGSVIGHSLVSLDELNLRINYGEVGDRMIDVVRNKML